MDVAVITPYCTEDASVLRRCIDSVAAQSIPAAHFMVADGHPSMAVADLGEEVRHVVLPSAHADNGNIARAIGSFLAAAEGYDAIAWLDADNWYQPNHLESLVHLHQTTQSHLCYAWRTLHRADGTQMPVDAAEEIAGRHVDTSGWLIVRSAFDLLRVWLMPRSLGPVCDRVFFQAAQRSGYRIAASRQKTVCFTTLYARHYERAGEAVPAGAKFNVIPAMRAWLKEPSNRQAVIEFLGFCPEI